jgi:ElaB/YqjD/DUF883 family membrane-anchored ribosome-binding protein
VIDCDRDSGGLIVSANNAKNDPSHEETPPAHRTEAEPKTHAFLDFDLKKFTPEALDELFKIDGEERDRLYKAARRKADRDNAERVLRNHVREAGENLQRARARPWLDFVGSGGWTLVGVGAGAVITKSALIAANAWLLNIGMAIGIIMAVIHIVFRKH